MTLYKKRQFLFVRFFLLFFPPYEALHVDYFDFKVRESLLFFPLVSLFFFEVSDHGRDVQWLQQYIGHNGLSRTLPSPILCVCVCDLKTKT